MSVLILILKIIGIVLLSLFGLIVLMILAVLFWPAGYRITGKIDELEKSSVALKARLHWLCYLISFRFVMENGEQLAVLRIFGFPIQIYPVIEKKTKKKRATRRKKRKRKMQKKQKAQEPLDHTIVETKQIDENKKTDESMLSDESVLSDESMLSDESKPTSDVTEAPNTPLFVQQSTNKKADSKYWHKATDWLKQIKEKIVQIINWLRAIPEKIKKIFSQISNIKNWLWDENNKKTIRLIYEEIIYLLLHYHPRKVIANLDFSIGDPALTGQVLGILSMMPFLYHKKVRIGPDFQSESVYVKGTFEVRGRIRMIHLVRSLLHIWKDETIKTLIKSRT